MVRISNQQGTKFQLTGLEFNFMAFRPSLKPSVSIPGSCMVCLVICGASKLSAELCTSGSQGPKCILVRHAVTCCEALCEKRAKSYESGKETCSIL